MPKYSADKYTYTLTWENNGQKYEYTGRCLEFPAMVALAKTQRAALRNITDYVAEFLAENEEMGIEAKSPQWADD